MAMGKARESTPVQDHQKQGATTLNPVGGSRLSLEAPPVCGTYRGRAGVKTMSREVRRLSISPVERLASAKSDLYRAQTAGWLPPWPTGGSAYGDRRMGRLV